MFSLLELQAMRITSSNVAAREEAQMASEREESRHRLARTLEAELKAIAGAMDEGAIQSMWDSHPTLDSIRRRRRGEWAVRCGHSWGHSLRVAVRLPRRGAIARGDDHGAGEPRAG